MINKILFETINNYVNSTKKTIENSQNALELFKSADQLIGIINDNLAIATTNLDAVMKAMNQIQHETLQHEITENITENTESTTEPNDE